MLYLIIALSSFLSGMGIGGGGLVIILLSNFNLLSHKESMLVSIIMFIVSGFISSLENLKNKKINKNELNKYFFKIIIFLIIGSVIGSQSLKYISEEKIKIYFNIFMLIIGIYEIISSLKSFKKGKI